jgi:alkaline phosphatase D
MSIIAASQAQNNHPHLTRPESIARQRGEEPKPLRPEWAPFYHGVASGDPLADRVVIWTRVTPDNMDNTDDIEVTWKVAEDPQLIDIVRVGKAIASAERDFTVKVDVDSLQPDMTYYYGFSALNKHSLTGRAKTTPQGAQARHLRFGVVSCNNYQAGYFNAFQRLAERHDLDAIIHLGDYIYEYEDGRYGDSLLFGKRSIEPPNEILSLEDYRTRYSTYRLDTSLVRAHQQHPFITVWDDHESANDAYVDGAQNHDPRTEGDWEARKAAAKQAYFEWMPIRDNAAQQVFRLISYGDLLDLFMLDTRLEGREMQILDPFDPAMQDRDRTILGIAQKTWLLDQLGRSKAQWKVLAQQVVFSPFEIGWAAPLAGDPNITYATAQGFSQDIWNGYPAERRQIINFLRDEQLDDVVILTGDFHTSYAFDVSDEPVRIQYQDIPGRGIVPFYSQSETYDPLTGEGSVAVEFATPSITSANFDENFGAQLAAIFQALINNVVAIPGGPPLGNPNPHLKYVDLTQHGYFILDLTPERAQADWYFSAIGQPTTQETFAQGWLSRGGENRLRRAGAPANPKATPAAPAPADPPAISTGAQRGGAPTPAFTILGLYPNPFNTTHTLYYAVNRTALVRANLLDVNGKVVKSLLDVRLLPGLYTLETTAGELPNGVYFYQIQVDDQQFSARVILAR